MTWGIAISKKITNGVTLQEAVLRLIERSEGEITFAQIGRRLGITREWARILARRAGSDARIKGVHRATCAWCGKEFRARRSQVKEGRRFCSRECYMASRKAGGSRGSNKEIKPQRPTPRQVELLMHMAMGESYHEIGDQLGLSPNTVKNQLHKMIKRLGARNSTHALAIALQHGWIDIREIEEQRPQYVDEMVPIIEEIRGRLDEASEKLSRLEKSLGIVSPERRQ